MEHNMLTLEFGRDTVTYEGRTTPSGTLGCEALNISDEAIASLIEPCKACLLYTSHRPISSAKGTGGLNFLIADALLILCHSLFEVVIKQVLEWNEI